MSRKPIILLVLALVILCMVAGCNNGTENGKGADSPSDGDFVPSLTTWSSYDVGSSTYMQAAFLGEAITEKYGTKVRIIPASSPITRHLPLRMKEVDMTFTGLDGWLMQEGLYEYSEISWGPQPVQIIWFAQTGGFPHAVRADSDIYTPEDLKGKRVPYFPGSATLNLYTDALLAFANLTRDDVISVDVPSYVGAQDMTMNGELDACLIATEAPKAYEWAAMPYGMRYIEMPHDNVEGWERANKIFPEFGKYVAAFGANIEDEPIEVGVVSSPRLTVYDWLDEDYAYFLTKAIYETYDLFAPKNEAMELFWTLDNNFLLFEGSSMPFHPGAVKFFKEIGVWTDEYEQMNQERLKRQKDLQALWDQVVEEATEKEIPESEFPNFWMEKRAEAGF